MRGIYISNLSEGTTEGDLVRHFSHFGNVNRCIIFRFKDGRCKGFAKVTMSDSETYRRVMGFRGDHMILGRKANIEPFIENREIVEQRNYDVEQRKICVLGIPKSFREVDLHQLFDFFGEIERAYLRLDDKKDKNFGFIIFKTARSAKIAIKQGSLFIQDLGIPLRIKKFRSNKGYKEFKNSKKNNYKANYAYGQSYPNRNRACNFEPSYNTGLSDCKNPILEDFGYVKKSETPNIQGVISSDLFLQNKTNLSLEKVIKELKIEFMSIDRLKKYIKAIIVANKEIRWIMPKDMQKLELFFFNGNNMDSKLLRQKLKNLSLKIDLNHQRDNIRINENCPRSTQKELRL